ncbi:C-C motif chemokine 21b-like [Conger conger]|nr:C-C motif chemokine 21b-like [Conger conger]
MKLRLLTFLLLLACVCLTLAQGSYEDCCLKYVRTVPKKIRHLVVAYRHQETDGDCNIPAIVFILRKGRVFCADPSQGWAQHLINRIDSRKHHKRPKRRG